MDQQILRNYQKSLTSLRTAGGVLLNLQVPQLSSFLPHLEDSEIHELVKKAEAVGTVLVIGPPVLILGAEQVFLLTFSEASLSLIYQGVYRRKESYARINVPRAWTAADYDYRERVATFASTHWHGRLSWDESDACLAIRIGKDYTAVVSLDSDPFLNAQEQPLTHLIDASVIQVVTDYYEMSEIRTFSNPYCFDFCSRCGGGLNPGCTFCKLPQDTDLKNLSTTPFPLPLGISSLLRKTFEVDPLQANCHYLIRWAQERLTYTPPRDSDVERSRPISLRDS